MAHVIAVAGKGGVGKTTLCGLLIQYLCESGKGPVLAVDADITAATLNQILAHISRLNPGIHPVFAETGLLAQIQVGNLRCAVGDVKVPILVAIINSSVATMNL